MKHLLLAAMIGLLTSTSLSAQDSKAPKEPIESKEVKVTKSPHEDIAEESLKALDRAVQLLTSAKDKKSSDDSRAKVPEVTKALVQLKEKFGAVGEPSKEQRAAIERQYKSRFDAAVRRFREEAIRVATSVEGGKELLDELDKAIKPLTAKKN